MNVSVSGPLPPGDALDSGDVLVFHTPTPLQRLWQPSLWLPFLIHLSTRSRWNHVALSIGTDTATGEPLMVGHLAAVPVA